MMILVVWHVRSIIIIIMMVVVVVFIIRSAGGDCKAVCVGDIVGSGGGEVRFGV